MLKRTFTLGMVLTVFAMLFAIGDVSAQSRLKKAEKAASRLFPHSTAEYANNAPDAYKTGLIKKAEGTTSDILVEEDFAGFTYGTPGNPDTDHLLASIYTEPGPYIDDSFTEQPGWFGSYVYSSGGKCVLHAPSLSDAGYLCTPLGDYSGHITVTLKARALKSEGTGSSLYVMAQKGGLSNASYAETDDEIGYDTRLYVSQGWAEIKYTFDNYSADNDGFICFSASGAVEIDDIKITTTPTFLASPHVLGATDFTTDGFTINWEKVRKSFNYYIDLYKKVYLSDQDSEYVADFEGDSPLDGKYTYSLGTNSGIEEGVGADDSKALVLHNGDTITTPTSQLSPLRNMTFYLKTVEPSAESEWDYEGYIYIDALTSTGWENLGSFYADAFVEGDDVDLDEEMYNSFKNNYLGVRLRIGKLPDDGYVIFDNIDVTTAPEAKLDTIEGDFPGYYYAQAEGDETSYTFSGLDPYGEYYYTIRSHYVFTYSTPVLYEAFGVSTPEIKPATAIDSRGSYTANFSLAPKATSYVVSNYGVRTVAQDGEFEIIDEDFSKVTSDVTASTDPMKPTSLDNYEEISLDEYADNPGWSGVGNTLSESCVGAQESYFVSSILYSPRLYLSNSDYFTLYIKAYGEIGTTLYMSIDGKLLQVQFVDSGDGKTGIMDGSVDIAETGSDVQIKFYTTDYTAFMIDRFKISQNLKKGDRVYTLLSQQTTDEASTSTVFNGLGEYDYDLYAYNVTSVIEHDGKTATSKSSDFMLVDLANGTSTTRIEDILSAKDNTVVARYAVNGTRLTAPQRGINILKMSDGSIVKQMVK